jgi:hypothetical protein
MDFNVILRRNSCFNGLQSMFVITQPININNRICKQILFATNRCPTNTVGYWRPKSLMTLLIYSPNQLQLQALKLSKPVCNILLHKNWDT